jgi:uncharacterized protein (DUF1501 family)
LEGIDMTTDLRTRREVLALAAATAGSALGGIQLAYAKPVDGAQAPARLVVVVLRGAMDGLSLLAPHGEAAYYQARPTIAIARPGEADGLIALDRLFGLHPAFAPMKPHWDRQQLAFVHASGSPDPTRSHFDAQDYLESATPGRKTTSDGWLNRLASVLTGPQASATQQRLQALNLGPTMPRIFMGDAAVASLASGNAATAKGVLDRPQVADAFAELYAGDDRLSQTVREATATRREIRINLENNLEHSGLKSDDPSADRGALPLAGLPRDTARLGQLMARDARIRLAFVPVGGWDTHAGQGSGKGALANRFALLAQSLDALAQGLGDALKDTTVLVMSEFGRTLRQNGTNGTDHGHGNVAMLLGAGVKGGQIHGAWPGLDAASLYEGRDLAITTDFRDIVADVLEQRFRLKENDLAQVLPGMAQRRRVGVVV